MQGQGGQKADSLLAGLGFDLSRPLLGDNELRLGGWAASPAGIDSVRVRVGDEEATAARGLAAPDWVEELPDWPGAAMPWFEIAFDCSRWRRGRHPIEVLVADRAGRSQRFEAMADVQPFGPPPLSADERQAALAAGKPLLWCESPDLLGGSEWGSGKLAGYAYAGSGIEAVLVTVDGRTRVPADTGLLCPNLLEELGPEVARHGGFLVDLGEDVAPLGWRLLSVVAVAADGAAVGLSGRVNRVRGKRAPEPRPAVEGRGVDEGGERFAPAEQRHMSLAPEHYARYRWAARLLDGGRVLDAGCGVGWGTALLSGRAAEAVGVDLSSVAISAARRNYGELAEFRRGNLYALPFESDSFDAVVCFEAIEHVEEPAPVLDELRRVLRPDGLLLVSSPNRGVYPAGNPFHLRELTSNEMRELLCERFAHVELQRQATHFASALFGTEAISGDDPQADLQAEVRKLVGVPPGRELYAVAAASDAPLPRTPPELVLGTGADYEEARSQASSWKERAVRAEAEAASIDVAVDELVRQQRKASLLRQAAGSDDPAPSAGDDTADLEATAARLNDQLAAEEAVAQGILGSSSWRLTGFLRDLSRRARVALIRLGR